MNDDRHDPLADPLSPFWRAKVERAAQIGDGKPGPKPHKPDKALILRIATEEAKKRRVPLDDVLGGARRRKVVVARRAAIARVAAETGCSMASIARAWGVDAGTVERAMRRGPLGPYDAATMARLTWQHGPARAAQIAAGKDPNTENDIAAWRRLCAAGGGI